MDNDDLRVSVGDLRKIIENLPDNADVVIRLQRPRADIEERQSLSEGMDYFIRTALPWVYDNKMEALVLIPE
jgi:hypothetical protein